MLIDTHAHLLNEYYDDITKVIDDSKKLGVGIVINSGCDNSSNREVLKIANEYNNVYVSFGIHPEFADNYQNSDLDFIEDNINNDKLVAIGEIGLDYHYEGYNKEKQMILFEKQLKLAQKYNLSVVIHSRDATLDTINILKKYSVTGVIHCFSGSKETAMEYIKMGYKLGIGGVCTYKNAKLIDIIKQIGIENIVLETDCPYLSPVPFRGKKNIPGNVSYVAQFISDELGVSKEEVALITTNNAMSIFDKIKPL